MEKFFHFNQVYTEDQANLISREFTQIKGEECYLDHAGATLYAKCQINSIYSQLMQTLYGNPHAKNIPSKLTDDATDIIRSKILSHFNTNFNEYSIVFTSGTTYSLKLIAESFNFENNGLLAYLDDNHTSVLGMRVYAKQMKCIKIGEIEGKNFLKNFPDQTNNSLFVFPAQSNFSGTKYPLKWIQELSKKPKWFTVLDAASFVSTNSLDLSIYKPDFVTISFYKIFGYPTGLGALIIKNSSAYLLEAKYLGGGTVFMSLVTENLMIPRQNIHEQFEAGTLPFLEILSLKHGFETITNKFKLNFNIISNHTFTLAQYVYKNLTRYHHANEQPVAILYHDTTFDNVNHQGGIINFNLFKPNGDYIGYSEVLHFANLYKIHLRTGCFCNPGACQKFLNLTNNDMKNHFKAGHVCGDENDLINGHPTGSIRISFGYMSTKNDADKFLNMIEHCFVNNPLKTEIILNEAKYLDNKLSIDSITITSKQSRKGILKQILLYPIKSCGAFKVPDKWQITRTGLKFDRQWMIINSEGVAITQKQNRKICLINPNIDLVQHVLTLNYPGMKNISIPLNLIDCPNNSAYICQSKVCGNKIQGFDCGNEIAKWLVDAVDFPGLRLLKQSNDIEQVSGRISSTFNKNNIHLPLSLVNKAQYLLINLASIKWLRNRITQNELSESLDNTILRFRPNFVVDFNEPFVENNFITFHIGQTKFNNYGKCNRCQIICIDQSTGQFSKEPLQVLSKEFHGKITFGIYLCNIENNYINDNLLVNCEVLGNELS